MITPCHRKAVAIGLQMVSSLRSSRHPAPGRPAALPPSAGPAPRRPAAPQRPAGQGPSKSLVASRLHSVLRK